VQHGPPFRQTTPNAFEPRTRIGDLPVYVSFDLGVLDMTIAPAVSNPEPGRRASP
jgi:arginase family enzyme